MKSFLRSSFAGSVLLAAAVSAWSAEVTRLEDGGPGSLRQAILEAIQGETILLNASGVITLTNEITVNKDLSLVGPGAVILAISGNLNSRVFNVTSNVAVTISGVTIQDGRALNGADGFVGRPGTAGADGSSGGAIYNAGRLVLTECILTNNAAGTGGVGGTGAAIEDHTWWGGPGGAGGNGGAIYNHASGELTLNRCTVTGNSSGSGGRGGRGGDGKTGGLFEIGDVGGDGGAGGAAGLGGGIYNAGVFQANLCTISGNENGAGGAGGHGGNGYVGTGDDGEKGRGGNGGRGGRGGGVCSLTDLLLRSCTVAFNSAGPGGERGAPGDLGEGATVWGVAGSGGSPGGILNLGGSQVAQIVNTIVALNVDAANVIDYPQDNNALGAFLSLGHNLVETTVGSTGFGVSGDQIGRPSFVQPLADNGGPTWTHALWPESPAVNAGDNAYSSDLPTDQRGFPRVSCTTVDIGAFEYAGCPWMPHPAARNTLYFDGIDDYLQGGDLSLSNASFTVEAWAKRDLLGTPDGILGQGTAATTRGLIFGFNSNNSFTFSFFTNVLETTATYNDREWHHWAGTYDTNGQVRLIYRDGALVASNTASANYGGSGALRIGDVPWKGWAFDGEIDEVRVWNVARTAVEIRENLGRSLTGAEAGLVAYLRFDEEVGSSIAYDSSSKGLNGTLYGGPAYVFSGARLYQPMVTTLDASPVRSTTATFRGRVNPAGPHETQVWFDYGTSPNFGSRTAMEYAGTGMDVLTYSNAVTSLQPGTKYYFRIVARNEAGTNYGEPRTFDTPVVGFGYPVTSRATSGHRTTFPRHTTDADGNIYLTGLFTDSIQFNQTLRAEGSGTNAFVAKLLRGGDWDWAIYIPVTNGQLRINALAMQDKTNVVVAGSFSGSANFGGTVVSSADDSAFVALLKPDSGGWSWVTQLGTNSSANAIAVGASGGIYAAGYLEGSASLGNETVSASGSSDILVTRLGTSGRVVWARLAGGTGRDTATSLMLDASEAVFVTGSYSNSANFGSISLTNAGSSDLFFTKLNPTNGLFDLAIRAGGGGMDRGIALTVDPTGPIYLAGQFEGEADFKGATLPELSAGHSYLLVAQVDAQGTLLRRTVTQSAQAGSLTATPSGRVYLAGDFGGVMTYGKTSTPLATQGSRDVFLAQLVPDHEGSLAWDKLDRIGGLGLESCGTVSVDQKGSVVVSGTYSQSLVLGYVQLSTDNAQEIFVARLDPDGTYEHNRWTIGLTINVPEEAQDSNYTDGRAIGYPYSIEVLQTPRELADSDGLNSFFWNDTEKRLYAIRPVTVRIKWPLSSSTTNLANAATVVGRCFWPDSPQTNVAGAPVELQGPGVGHGFSYGEVLFNTNGVSVMPVTRGTDQFQVFQTSTGAAGYNVIRYTQPGGQSAFEVVYTRPYGSWAGTNVALVGNELKREGHADSTGKNGYVYHEKAFYDASVHNRASRTGFIIPVNRNLHNDPQRDLVVVWYRTNVLTGVAWGGDPVRYTVVWPEAAQKLVIASGQGFDLSRADSYPQAHVYRQPDPNLAGFNPNEEHALIIGNQLYALRSDLNETIKPKPSEPYVLLKYLDPHRPMGDTNSWRMKVMKVVAEEAPYWFESFASGQAGLEVQLPAPLSLLPLCASSNRIAWGTNCAHQAWNGEIFAKSAGYIQVAYWYPIQPDFYVGTNDWPVGKCVPWMSQNEQRLLRSGAGRSLGDPVLVGYDVVWPEHVATLEAGETLTTPKRGLPDLLHFASAQVVFDQGNPDGRNPGKSLVRVFDPLSERTIQLADDFELPDDIAKSNDRGRWVFPDLPWHIRIRLFYDDLNQRLSFGGWYDAKFGAGEPLLLPNILSPHERDRIADLSEDQEFRAAVARLYDLTRNPNQVDVNRDGEPDRELLAGLITQIRNGYEEILVGPVIPGPSADFVISRTNVLRQMVSPPATNIVQESFGDLPKALTAALRYGSGYVTVVENDDPELPGQPISLHVLYVTNQLFQGDLKVLPSDYVFDERLTLRHSGDFGGEPQNYEFEWYYQPDQNGVSPPLPVLTNVQTNWNGWIAFPTPPYGQSNGFNDIILGEGGNLSSLMVLSDNWLLCRYRAFTEAGATAWSDWVGEPGGGRAILAEGWIKRVTKGLNAFDSRVKDFHTAPAATYASMILQAGERYEGPVAFNSDPNYLSQMGLIQSYETVLDRGRKLSIDGLPAVNFGPANNALLLAAGRIADLYMLLGNEAYADASDPTIGFTTSSGTYGNLAPSIFCFQNQLDSPLEEELTLLRGRDDSGMTVRARPLYNRLIWNFTLGEGEVAYSQHYNISDQNKDGFIDEKDARALYPQGHGDAWGHYLTAMKRYYELLRHSNYTWLPRPEAVLVGGVSVQVDYLDERKFAAAAAAKAKAGAEIVNLTYRQKYVEDPAGQWQGYKDTQLDRAWGVSEWATRAGLGAYFDWVVANAIVPATDPDTSHVGIQKIDRTTVTELGEIPAQFSAIEGQLNAVDRGLNPLGLAAGTMPFDIDPSKVAAGQTHFDQIYQRALKAMENTLALFDHVNTLSQNLRRNQDSVDEFTINVNEKERDFKNRLIEIFGYPFTGDIGAAGTYPSGYDGPDIYHYMYVNDTDLTSDAAEPSQLLMTYFKKLSFDDSVSEFFPEDWTGHVGNPGEIFTVQFPLCEGGKYKFAAPLSWGQRRAQGTLQDAISDTLKARMELSQGLVSYNNLRLQIQDQLDLLAERQDTHEAMMRWRRGSQILSCALNTALVTTRSTEVQANFIIDTWDKTTDIAVESLPKSVGFSTDVFAPSRGILKLGAKVGQLAVRQLAANANIAQTLYANAKDIVQQEADIEVAGLAEEYEIEQKAKEVKQLLREEAERRLGLLTLQETLQQAHENYLTTLARGQRLLEERYHFRIKTSGKVQEHRYQDMAFRIFQNDALQKYRAQFDLAARYVYLAAKAYDYETCLLETETGAGSKLLTAIVRQRTLGQVVRQGVDLQPISGRHGLADPLARLGQNFEVYRGQLGFATPETETGRFSLRSELFRIRPGDLQTNALNGVVSTNEDWHQLLQQCRVPDLWQVPEFRRFCRPFAPESAGPQPGLVIRIPTTVTFGLNYFGWPLGPGDSAYDPSRFATKVRSAGVWFDHYNLAGLSMTPRVYLVPAGLDILRSPSGHDLTTREFNVVDQKLPVPFPIGSSELSSPGWIPLQDSLSETFGDIRRFSSFRAYHDKGWFDENEATQDTRLIGRSVWNTEWLLIIPGGTFLYDPDRGLDTFISTVGDIKIFFQTYSYSGN